MRPPALEPLKPFFQLTQAGLQSSVSETDLVDLRETFARQHYVQFPEFILAGLLSVIEHHLERAAFKEWTNEVGTEPRMSHNEISGLMYFMMNDGRLFNFIERITGCERIGSFRGRVYRFLPEKRHAYSWHDDLGCDRLIALSINLGREPYKGGILQIRDRMAGRILCHVSNVGFGDCVIFRLSSELDHRVTNVEGDVPRTAYAGWFQLRPSIEDLFRLQFPRLGQLPSP